MMIIDIDFEFLVKNIKEKLRDSDIFARFGGEEFIILLPKTHREEALLVAQKMRKHIEKSVYITKDEVHICITVSVGVTELLYEETGVSSIIQRADEALYLAKETGRNKVVVK